MSQEAFDQRKYHRSNGNLSFHRNGSLLYSAGLNERENFETIKNCCQMGNMNTELENSKFIEH